MMMSFESENHPVSNDDSSNKKFCIHCSILLPQSNENNINGTNQIFSLDSMFLGAEDNMSSSPTTTSSPSEWLSKALSSIFKLNYLNAFDTFKEDQIQVELLALCQNCHQILSNLHQLYNDFLELGKIDSYLHKKLQRLDEIIDSHQQKTISCDLIIAPFYQIDEDYEPNDCNFPNYNEDEPESSHNFGSTSKKFKNEKIKPSKTIKRTETAIFPDNGRELRILLTRLPEKYTRRQQAKKVKEDDDNPHDDLELLSKVKIEVEENDAVCTDEDDGYVQPSSPFIASDSSEDYLAKSVRKGTKKKKKSSTVKEEPPAKKRGRGRPPKNASSSSINEKSKRKTKRSYKKIAHSSTPSNKRSRVKNPAKSHGKTSTRIPLKGLVYSQTMRTRRYMARKAKYANPCWYCKRHFPTPADCFEHTKQEHLPSQDDDGDDCSISSLVMCNRCSRICINDKDLQTHCKKCQQIPFGETIPKMYPCSECSKSFLLPHLLNGHMLCHLDDRPRPQPLPRPFPCDQCSFRATTVNVLERHKLSLHTAHLYKCDECGIVLKNKYILNGHKLRMHTPEGHERYRQYLDNALAKDKEKRRVKAMSLSTICGDCNLDLFSRLAFLTHRKTFHGDSFGNFVCETCGQEFTLARSLRDHNKFVHSDARPYLCTQCGKSFKRSYNLKSHEKNVHTEEGRLAYNRSIRQTTQRRKIRQKHLLQLEKQQEQQQQQQYQQQGTEVPNNLMDRSFPQPFQNSTTYS